VLVYRSGDDVILDFDGSEDRIDLTGIADLDSFADVRALARNTGTGLALEFAAGDLSLVGIRVADLVANDFLI
jgi:hypothetical protein